MVKKINEQRPAMLNSLGEEINHRSYGNLAFSLISFIYALFNDIVANSECTVSNDVMINGQ